MTSFYHHNWYKKGRALHWDSVLKSPAHHADTRKNEPSEADNGPSVHGESFEG
jgi:hypothetical protein